MQKEPFNLGSLSPDNHPIAFLLILCDELQEWNREAYGIMDKLRTLAAEARIEVGEDNLGITFVTHNGSLPAGFSREKKRLLKKLLDSEKLFKHITIHSHTIKKPVLPRMRPALTPRPQLDDLEKLAREIHNLYNQKQQERNPDRPLKYPDFDFLPDSLKYSNLRQAEDIYEKLRLMGYTASIAEKAENPITVIPNEYVEELARKEHESWVDERLHNGWTLSIGVEADAEKKTSPYLIPYIRLPEDVKEMDRDPVRNIPLLLAKIGMAVVMAEEAAVD